MFFSHQLGHILRVGCLRVAVGVDPQLGIGVQGHEGVHPVGDLPGGEELPDCPGLRLTEDILPGVDVRAGLFRHSGL